MRARTAPCAIALATASIWLAAPARADDDFGGAKVIFARGTALYQVDARGRGEIEIAQLAARIVPQGFPRAKESRGPHPAIDPSPSVVVRALRSDASGTVLLADLAGKWAWMPLDGSARSLTDLPCADGPAQLADDGMRVLCRSPANANRSILVELPRGARAGRSDAMISLDVPPTSARLIGAGAEQKVVWADATGAWAASPSDAKNRIRVSPDVPLRGFLPSPDGTHAVGTYADQIFDGAKHPQPADVLMTVQLDGLGARRKASRDGVAVEWSRDSQWLLVQEGARACIMRAGGGQYKCWRGYTAASLSSDGRWALVLGNRDGSKKQKPSKRAKPSQKPTDPRPVRPPPVRTDPEPGDMPWDHIDEPSDEPEGPDEPLADDDVSVPPPSGPLSLFRVKLEGAFTERPALLVKVVDGAAVWVPTAP